MTDLDEHGRPEPPIAGDETATLLGFLDYQRATLAWKCAGLDAAGLRATVGASTITLGGLLKHLAFVEDYWFGQPLASAGEAAALGHGGLEGRPGLGVALGSRGFSRAACARSGRKPWTAPGRSWPKPWRAAAWSNQPGAPGAAVSPPACAGSWST